MIENLKSTIRKRSREGWEQMASEYFTDMRIWIQEHGEKSAILSLILGIIIVAAFRVFIFLVVIGLLLCSLVWLIALPEGEQEVVADVEVDQDSNES